ncbi:MAG: hypothetical protein WBW33_21600 [Bryobacteraceae bacterium]
MRILLLVIGLVAALTACRHDSKLEQAKQAQTASAPPQNQTGQPVVEATIPELAPGTVNSAQASTTQPPSEAVAPPANPAPPDGPTQPTLEQRSAPVQLSASKPSPAPVPAPPIAIPAGTQVRVRLAQTIDTKRNRSGDRFEATLISPVQVNGEFLLPSGTTFVGHVTEAKPSGRFKGRAILGVELDSFTLDHVVYRVVTAPATRVSGRHRKRNWILIGGGAGFGAGVGAVAGGGVGALIGAGAGAGAGAVGAFFTGRKNVSLPVETPLTFRLRTEVALSSAQQPG